MSYDPDTFHKAEYEKAIEYGKHIMPADWKAPAWEDLTDEQKENVRAENRAHQKYMNDLGEAIRTGGPYPDVPK